MTTDKARKRATRDPSAASKSATARLGLDFRAVSLAPSSHRFRCRVCESAISTRPGAAPTVFCTLTWKPDVVSWRARMPRARS